MVALLHFTTASWEPKNPTMRNLCFKVLRILLLVVASFSICLNIYFLFVHGIIILYLLLLLLYCRWNWSFETTRTILPLTHHSHWEYHLLFVCMWSLNLWYSFFSTWFLFLYFILYNFDCAIFTLVWKFIKLAVGFLWIWMLCCRPLSLFDGRRFFCIQQRTMLFWVSHELQAFTNFVSQWLISTCIHFLVHNGMWNFFLLCLIRRKTYDL